MARQFSRKKRALNAALNGWQEAIKSEILLVKVIACSRAIREAATGNQKMPDWNKNKAREEEYWMEI